MRKGDWQNEHSALLKDQAAFDRLGQRFAVDLALLLLLKRSLAHGADLLDEVAANGTSEFRLLLDENMNRTELCVLRLLQLGEVLNSNKKQGRGGYTYLIFRWAAVPSATARLIFLFCSS